MIETFSLIGQFSPEIVGIWALAAMVAIYLIREWRETRKLSAEDRLALRDGYSAQVLMLMDENRNLRHDLVDLEKRHDEYRAKCQAETTDLQGQIHTLQTHVRRLEAVAEKL